MRFRFPWWKKSEARASQHQAGYGLQDSNHAAPESTPASVSGESSALSHDGQQALRDHHESLTQRAREEHDALSYAIGLLEQALAETPLASGPEWLEQVAAALERIRECMRAHADGVEEPEGLFDEIKTVQPRLAARAENLAGEHESLATRATALAKNLSAQTHGVDGIREEAGKLLSRLRAHRAAEAELVYEAFWTELGVGD